MNMRGAEFRSNWSAKFWETADYKGRIAISQPAECLTKRQFDAKNALKS